MRFIWTPADPIEGCQLDSFSEPSLASAILRRKAQGLMTSYTEYRPITISTGELEQRQPGAKGIIENVEELRRDVCAAEAELDADLMVIYFDNQRWNQFLDRYLHFIHSNPESPNVLPWAWPALTFSKRCNRTEEVYCELENLTHFHPTLKTAPGLTNVLAEWRAEAKPFPGESVYRTEPAGDRTSLTNVGCNRP